MGKTFVAVLLIVTSASKAEALTEIRMEQLYDVAEQSMKCEVYASYSEFRGSEEHRRLYDIWMRAGIEIGGAMVVGQIPVDDPGYGRRCWVSFNVPEVDEIDDFNAGLLIGVELGKVRTCIENDEAANGPLRIERGGEEVLHVENYVSRLRQVGTRLFEERNCRFVTFPE